MEPALAPGPGLEQELALVPGLEPGLELALVPGLAPGLGLVPELAPRKQQRCFPELVIPVE